MNTRPEKNKIMNGKVRRSVVPHETVRLDIPIPQTYEEFRRRFETAVPLLTPERVVEWVKRNAPWSEVVADVKAAAPYEFLLYWKADLEPLMSLAGNKSRATEYLMGNHVIAETMYRHDPLVALYVPLRCAIYEGDGITRFTIEQPSTTLSGLGCEEITQVALDLDRKLGRLLAALSVEVPEPLAESRAAG
ncbi:MAG: DUF302 domain-containing protein [Terriglobales bacterium]|jgi:hypothetical protein